MITAKQSRAARALLNWSQADLARASGLGWATVARLERSAHNTREEKAQAIQTALEAAGIEFIERDDGAVGVLLRN